MAAINPNAKALKSATTNVDVSAATAPSSGQVLTATGTTAATWQTPSSGSALTILPMIEAPLSVSTPTNNRGISDNTTMYIGVVIIPFSITANKITIRTGTSHTADGTLDLTLYSESGGSQIFSVTTATINATSTLFTTSLSAVSIPAGKYYFGVNGNSTVNTTIIGWQENNANAFSTTAGIRSDVSSEPVMSGTLTITADTPPATITPTSITEALNSCIVFRLDN